MYHEVRGGEIDRDLGGDIISTSDASFIRSFPSSELRANSPLEKFTMELMLGVVGRDEPSELARLPTEPKVRLKMPFSDDSGIATGEVASWDGTEAPGSSPVVRVRVMGEGGSSCSTESGLDTTLSSNWKILSSAAQLGAALAGW